MDPALFSDRLEGMAPLNDPVDRLVGGHRAEPTQPVEEGFSLDHLHHQVRKISLVARIESVDDVGMVQPAEAMDFILEARAADGISPAIASKHLEGNRAIQIRVASLEHNSDAATTDLADQSVATKSMVAVAGKATLPATNSGRIDAVPLDENGGRASLQTCAAPGVEGIEEFREGTAIDHRFLEGVEGKQRLGEGHRPFQPRNGLAADRLEGVFRGDHPFQFSDRCKPELDPLSHRPIARKFPALRQSLLNVLELSPAASQNCGGKLQPLPLALIVIGGS